MDPRAARKQREYQERVKEGLDRAFEGARSEPRRLDLDGERLVVLSDHHRGARDGADDFWRCERSYHAALGYYAELGYRLVLLGDVDELWENEPEAVLDAYGRTLKLEQEFHGKGRLDRFWGNHDDLWRHEREVSKHLAGRFPGLPVREALLLEAYSGGSRAGAFFLVHGHQGTLDSDRYSFVSRLFVRYAWRPLQRRLNMASTTPARDFVLRASHDEAMFEWARGRPERLVLIAGHTHRPVFSTPKANGGRSAELVGEELQRLRAAAEAAEAEIPADPRIPDLRAELELVSTAPYGDPPKEMPLPCYFNTGCCSFGDGDITGLEIADGEIRLVRWLNDKYEPRKQDLASRELRDVFAAVSA
jgi:hypothetical protein